MRPPLSGYTRLIQALRGAVPGYSAARLAEMLGYAEPSIRRLVFRLRAAGWRIETNDELGMYSLGWPERLG